MGWFNKLFGGGATAAATGVVKVAEGVSDIAERWKPSDAARFEQSMKQEDQTQKYAADARSYDPRSTGGGMVGELANVFVDVLSRLIRPGVTILLLGACFGWWDLPAPDTIPPVYFMWTQSVIAFWFGARTIFKDIPGFIKAVRK